MNDREDKFAVLFVDDEEKALKYFTKAFDREFPILVANSVAAAKEVLAEQANRIGVLVTDQRMPEAKGVDLLRHVRAEYPQITRMLTTAYSDLEDAIDAVNRGEIIRYISKPWDVKTLRIELQQAMQLFLLRRERDQLMREKLSAWQRMQGLNRVRDLLSMASGISKTRRALPAMQAFIEQAPLQGTNVLQTEELDVWGNLQKDIIRMLELGQATVAALDGGARPEADSARATLSQCFNEAAGQPGAMASLALETGPELPDLAAHASQVTWLLTQLLRWLSSRAPEGLARATTEVQEECVILTLAAPQATWSDTSLLSVSPELLACYLICYDLGGSLTIQPQSDIGLSIAISFPRAKSDASETPSIPDSAWLEDALLRFENWSQPPS